MVETIEHYRLQTRRASRIRIATLIAGIWILGIIVGVVGFYHTWNRMPQPIDVIMATTLLGPIAIPKSFSDLMGITNMYSTQYTLLTASVYWLVLLTLHWLAIKTASYIILLFAGIIILLSAFNWINVGTSMMGI